MLTHTSVTQSRLERLRQRERAAEAELAEVRAKISTLKTELSEWLIYEQKVSERLAGLRAHAGPVPVRK